MKIKYDHKYSHPKKQLPQLMYADLEQIVDIIEANHPTTSRYVMIEFLYL